MELSLERPPKQPGLAAQLPHVTLSKGRSGPHAYLRQSGTPGPLPACDTCWRLF